ncbi:MAG TPA: UDP-N-acetylglucosamine--N-acetylmuramyl-(pentapeptide) pyrophosphoryl-undecaprenol N-acetylglucosamine transferase [Galbitalea sp.]|jgi:UDP-N-acetylglucosamine--N-acetylmuramyl-(pentapeptide) pyrophosphoryl-undecaprenol N-acetylglucosamine transferase|nr:UDP-N-acetylglucosamine--N-acetylmuramyl-(pentapeptide) pyrophosphoryl-undecaprenol N-acetylglucosamine transferase [Galbitalea sp.]
MTTYLLAGGGTAGHVNPLLAVADRIRDSDPDAVVLVLGTKEGLEARLVPERGYELLTIERLPFPRRPGRAMLTFPGRFTRAVAQTRTYLANRGVDVVVGFGGYAAAPAYRAAHAAGIPIVIHEANARAGLANRLGARYTSRVGTVFTGTRLPHASVVGMPLRREIEQLDRTARRVEARKLFGLDVSKPTLLVTGGSTGARSINRTVFDSIDDILATGWQVLHIAGNGSELPASSSPGYHIIKYCDHMELAIAAADLAVARSGSVTLSEFAATGLPAVFVPYPVGNGEQRLNAADAVRAGGAMLVNDSDFTPARVRRELVPLLRDPARLGAMAAAIATVGTRDGSDRMVALVRDAAK